VPDSEGAGAQAIGSGTERLLQNIATLSNPCPLRTAAEVEREIANKIKGWAEVFRAEDLGVLRVQ